MNIKDLKKRRDEAREYADRCEKRLNELGSYLRSSEKHQSQPFKGEPSEEIRYLQNQMKKAISVMYKINLELKKYEASK